MLGLTQLIEELADDSSDDSMVFKNQERRDERWKRKFLENFMILVSKHLKFGRTLKYSKKNAFIETM